MKCQKSFSRRDVLKRHSQTHFATATETCSFCSSSFVRKDYLKQHEKGCQQRQGTLQGQLVFLNMDVSANTSPSITNINTDQTCPQHSWQAGDQLPSNAERLLEAPNLTPPRSMDTHEGMRDGSDIQQYPPALHFGMGIPTVHEVSHLFDTDAPYFPTSDLYEFPDSNLFGLPVVDFLDFETALTKHFWDTPRDYHDLGRVDIDHWPAKDQRLVRRHPFPFIVVIDIWLMRALQPSPPPFLAHAVRALREEHSDASIEGIMHPCLVDINTGAMRTDNLEAGQSAPPGFRLQLLPRIKCHDCPGKVYDAKPGTVVDDFKAHMKNRLHRQGVELRSWTKPATASGTLVRIINAVLHRDLRQLRRALFESQNGLMMSRYERDELYTGFIGSGLLTHAVQADAFDILRYLLDNGVPAKARDSVGRSALHWACYLGKTQMATLLVEKGAELNRHEYPHRGRTPFALAVKEGHFETVVELVEQEAKRRRKSPLVLACEHGHPGIVQKMLEVSTEVGATSLTQPLERALRKGTPKVVEILLEAGAEANSISDFTVTSLKQKKENRYLGPGHHFSDAAEKLRLLERFGLELEYIHTSSSDNGNDIPPI